MTRTVNLLLLASVLCTVTAWAQANRREPHVGYLYPAGGQQDSVFLVTVGGQSLRGLDDVIISGDGVRASVVKYFGRMRNPSKEQRQALQQRIMEVRDMRLAELAGKASPAPTQVSQALDPDPVMQEPVMMEEDAMEEVGLPEHPLLYGLDDMSLQDLAHLRKTFFNRKKKQQNSQIAETALIEITIAPGAATGDRELRLKTRGGLTNPMCFQVGKLHETRELEPNDSTRRDRPQAAPPLELPILMNGQVMPGDVDRFRFSAREGQRLAIDVQARHLIPFLADAVPGWFQATLTLFDPEGNEIAFEDDNRFNPDPILLYDIPKDGVYTCEIRDAIYRGREDFVYRLAMHEREGGLRSIQPIDPAQGQLVTADGLPPTAEVEPNNTAEDAQRVVLPRDVTGRIGKAGDVDVFEFEGRAGQEVVAEVIGRRWNSPLDSLLRLYDASGEVLAWNDDQEAKNTGLLTHHADSYLQAQLPRDGLYSIHLSDAQRHGGRDFMYRLRLTPPRPDFSVYLTPSSLNVRAGRSATLEVHVLRTGGFEGDITLHLKDAPQGFSLDGNTLPAGRDHIRMTITAPRKRIPEPLALQVEARATVNGQTLTRPVLPSEDMMQAFLYRHLVPSESLMVAVTPGGGQGIKLAADTPIRIPLGGTALVRVKTPKARGARTFDLELSDAPQGLRIDNVQLEPGLLTFSLNADSESAQVGPIDNLIVKMFAERPRGKQADGKARQKQRVPIGVLPAIPFEIVQQ